jgi:hypothetical protein
MIRVNHKLYLVLSIENNKNMIFVVRLFHIIATIILIASIIYIYYVIFTRKFSYFLLIPLGLLILEAIFLIYNRGKCPMDKVHKKYGDEKGFWDLFLPKRIVPCVVKVLDTITILGFIIILLEFVRVI